ncbi:ABC transporter ATP-binding protein [Streptomyces sp. NPDC005507]|uniref:ABC transporter ATP-binding protein n=1 Tax=unclassified Streptomyces TaxID=2593676 RepID=UPI0033B5FCF7
MLSVDDLRVEFTTPRGIAQVVNGAGLTLDAGELHGLVGESGSGKSVTARTVLGLLPQRRIHSLTGSVRYKGRELLGLSEKQWRKGLRGKEISMVFQDPMTALAPSMHIGDQVMMPVRQHEVISRSEARARMLDLLQQVGIPDPVKRSKSYPTELSGGQRQRVMIATALACDPALLIADEPTTALDVTVQAQILDLFDALREERGLAILLVSHDLKLIAERCDEVSVMYAGSIVERGDAKRIFKEPQHPYTRLLEGAMPRLEDPPHTRLKTIVGQVVDLHRLPTGCAFAGRCPDAQDDCLAARPTLSDQGTGHPVACFHSRGPHGADQKNLHGVGSGT